MLQTTDKKDKRGKVAEKQRDRETDRQTDRQTDRGEKAGSSCTGSMIRQHASNQLYDQLH